MSVTRTSLAAASAANTDKFQVTSATGATVGGLIQVDGEYSFIATIDGTWIGVRQRGAYASGPVGAHNILAPVTFLLASDLPDAPPATGTRDDVAQVSYGADGAIAVPTRNTRVILTKATAAAMTLADPTNLPDGIELDIQSATAAAHTVTLTAGAYGNTTGSDVMTFVAGIGPGFKLRSIKGKWGAVGGTGTAAGVVAA